MLPAFEFYVDGQSGTLTLVLLTASHWLKIQLFYPNTLSFLFWFTAFELTGLGRGGQQVQKCRDTYRKAVEVLVEIASLQVSRDDFA